MAVDCDALVIGAGPAGAATAIGLARAGWTVALVERHRYPRRKVCGECVSATGATLLDALGVDGAALAGPRHRRVAWYAGDREVEAAYPPMRAPPAPAPGSRGHRHGYALGRDVLDARLVERARELGVVVLQPAVVRALGGAPGAHDVRIERPGDREPLRLRARVVVDAHGSWERGPAVLDPDGATRPAAEPRTPRRDADLFGFKAVFLDADLPPGLLPVLAYPGGYGGLVVADGGRTTFAGCLRRDALRALRRGGHADRGPSAGEAFEAWLRAECAGLRRALAGATRDGAWLAVGPLRPGIRVDAPGAAFRVGNAAGESHPIVGEGIATALQSAALLCAHLGAERPEALDAARGAELAAAYAADWRRRFARRFRVAAAAARVAMHPPLARGAGAALALWPGLLTGTARLAGKAAPYVPSTARGHR